MKITEKQHPTIVIDTNVCLDLFVFHDPRWTKLLEGLQQKSLTAITQASCRDEWLAVLHYPQLPITDESRPSIAQAFDHLIQCVNPIAILQPKLPICRDKDDQKFMELARDAGAAYLITKDKALLKCAKSVAKLNLFQILSPERFLTTVAF